MHSDETQTAAENLSLFAKHVSNAAQCLCSGLYGAEVVSRTAEIRAAFHLLKAYQITGNKSEDIHAALKDDPDFAREFNFRSIAVSLEILRRLESPPSILAPGEEILLLRLREAVEGLSMPLPDQLETYHPSTRLDLLQDAIDSCLGCGASA